MSEVLYNRVGDGLRFWNETEIKARHRICDQIKETIQNTLTGVNQAWVFQQVDTPLIMPRDMMNASYEDDDIFALNAVMGDRDMALRAETTNGSYLMAVNILRTTKTKLPLCVWQLGQSFRRETSDGATAAKLRFNAFYQLEFQCIFSADTMADYASMVRSELEILVGKITGLPTRIVESDRLPSYSTQTLDIEVLYNDRWTEVASTSMRTDFPELESLKKGVKVFEVAFGADRMVAVSQGFA